MPETNRFGLSRKDYVGLASTLCTGCGHDSITNHLTTALFESDVEPWNVAKLSGIGCSSKTTAYFLNQAHGFNSLHGRMAPLATGVHFANPKLKLVGVSGDGDSMNIGLGGFAHLIRRDIPILYIVENNGVYGLTKGQFSATADAGSRLKSGAENTLQAIDVCQFALSLGSTFVARGFSGDKKQMVSLFKAALKHPGTAVVDVISPCVTFNNHEGSTKSFDAAKSNNQVLNTLGLVPPEEEIQLEQEDDVQTVVTLHDGTQMVVKKISEKSHDVTDRQAAREVLDSSSQLFYTGLFFLDPKPETSPTDEATDDQLKLPDSSLEKVLDRFR